MKIRLTPELAYIIGLWVARKSRVGIGVHGLPHVQEYFVKAVMHSGLMPSSKILVSGKKAYFYHSGYKKFFTEIEKEMDNRFRSRNALSAAFVAGVFDAAGMVANGAPRMKNVSLGLQLIIERLGFRIATRENYYYPIPPREFTDFILPYSQALRSGNERDPCP